MCGGCQFSVVIYGWDEGIPRGMLLSRFRSVDFPYNPPWPNWLEAQLICVLRHKASFLGVRAWGVLQYAQFIDVISAFRSRI
jgi:hypothetical protein